MAPGARVFRAEGAVAARESSHGAGVPDGALMRVPELLANATLAGRASAVFDPGLLLGVWKREPDERRDQGHDQRRAQHPPDVSHPVLSRGDSSRPRATL